jgi:hypothetical protein
MPTRMIRPEWAAAARATVRPTQIAVLTQILQVRAGAAVEPELPIVIPADMLIPQAMATAAVASPTVIPSAGGEGAVSPIVILDLTPIPRDVGVALQVSQTAILAAMRIRRDEVVAEAETA